MSSTLYSEAEFIRLSNRSENAFCFEMGIPASVTRCVIEGLSKEAFSGQLFENKWNAGATAHRRKEYQKAFAAYSKAHHGNGKVDEVQLRAMEHLAFLDRILWRAYEILECRREYVGFGKNKRWMCAKHGVNSGGSQLCQSAYESWVAKQNY